MVLSSTNPPDLPTDADHVGLLGTPLSAKPADGSAGAGRSPQWHRAEGVAMSPTDPGGFITTAAATDLAASEDLSASATDSRPSGPGDSAGVDALGDSHPRPFDPFDDPCNYLG